MIISIFFLVLLKRTLYFDFGRDKNDILTMVISTCFTFYYKESFGFRSDKKPTCVKLRSVAFVEQTLNMITVVGLKPKSSRTNLDASNTFTIFSSKNKQTN